LILPSLYHKIPALIIAVILSLFCSAQQSSVRIMFYNVENLFDTKNDSLINDDEFTPDGDRNWNNHRLYQKLNNIYKVIIGVGEWEPPAIVGLCEIENRFVLNKLVFETPLKNFDYKIVHYNSPDERGIDVALLYRKDLFEMDTSYPIPIYFPFDTTSKSRDILYVKGSFDKKDTFHVFINHWPSRYGGYLETKHKRNHLATVLKSFTDSLFRFNPQAKIVAMGDFNDGPYEDSFIQFLQSKNDTIDYNDSDLINLSAINNKGTLKYQESWDIFDQVIVSGALLKKYNGYSIEGNKSHVYKPDYLIIEDEKYLGEKPFRTYHGFKYQGGFSDHLPVYVDIKLE
jgi:hypothetical protein